ncbi:MAG TPA: MerR family transcriptional regulator [Gemmatimonadales bacterium]|nr:MerR family transcriptional regulator [Gemmatimonadales bacterium]
MQDSPSADALTALREYRNLAPWSLRDLATLAAAMLASSGVRPVNAAAQPRPNERTIRFYVTRGLVAPPDGRGTAATYSYRHLLQVLTIKLRQMEGATLATIAKELSEHTGDVLERRVAAALGAALPAPIRLPFLGEDAAPRGRAGRALRSWLLASGEQAPDTATAGKWHRVQVGRGVELLVHEDHPLARDGVDAEAVAEAVRLTLARLVAERDTAPGGHRPAPLTASAFDR